MSPATIERTRDGVTLTREDLQRWVDALREDYGVRHALTVEINGRLTSTGGRANYRRATIEIARWLFEEAPHDDLVDTVRHEFAHHLTYALYPPAPGVRGWAHGADWRDCAEAVGATPSPHYGGHLSAIRDRWIAERRTARKRATPYVLKCGHGHAHRWTNRPGREQLARFVQRYRDGEVTIDEINVTDAYHGGAYFTCTSKDRYGWDCGDDLYVAEWPFDGDGVRADGVHDYRLTQRLINLTWPRRAADEDEDDEGDARAEDTPRAIEIGGVVVNIESEGIERVQNEIATMTGWGALCTPPPPPSEIGPAFEPAPRQFAHGLRFGGECICGRHYATRRAADQHVQRERIKARKAEQATLRARMHTPPPSDQGAPREGRGCRECGARSWYLWRLTSDGALCGTCCNAQDARRTLIERGSPPIAGGAPIESEAIEAQAIRAGVRDGSISYEIADERARALPLLGAMIEAVRADPQIGRGSCSAIDECYTDFEIADEIAEALIGGKWGGPSPDAPRTPAEAAAFLGGAQALRDEVSIERAIGSGLIDAGDPEHRARWGLDRVSDDCGPSPIESEAFAEALALDRDCEGCAECAPVEVRGPRPTRAEAEALREALRAEAREPVGDDGAWHTSPGGERFTVIDLDTRTHNLIGLVECTCGLTFDRATAADAHVRRAR